MTHSTWKTVPQFSSPVWKILNSRRTYSSHAEITQIMQQWLPPPTPQDESPLQLTAIYLPMIQPVKAEESRRYFRCECFSAKLGLYFCVKSPAYLTHSLIPGGGAAWWDLPCCERQKSPANLAASWCVFFQDPSAVLPRNSIGITGKPKSNSHAVAFTSEL